MRVVRNVLFAAVPILLLWMLAAQGAGPIQYVPTYGSLTSDPGGACVSGSHYYNTASNTERCCVSAVWGDCGGNTFKSDKDAGSPETVIKLQRTRGDNVKPVTGFGPQIEFDLEGYDAGSLYAAGTIGVEWAQTQNNADAGVRNSRLTVSLMQQGVLQPRMFMDTHTGITTFAQDVYAGGQLGSAGNLSVGGAGTIASDVSTGGDYLPINAATRVTTPLAHTVGNLLSEGTPEEGGLAIVVPADGRPIVFWLVYNGGASALRSARCSDTQCTTLSATANLVGFGITGRSLAPGATILPNGEVWISFSKVGGAYQFGKCANADCSSLTTYGLNNSSQNAYHRGHLTYNPATGSLTELAAGINGGPLICRNPAGGCSDYGVPGLGLVDAVGWIDPSTNWPVMFGRTGTSSVRTVCSDDHCGGGTNFSSQLSDIWFTVDARMNPVTGLPAILYASANGSNAPSYSPYTYKYVKCTNVTCSSMIAPVTVATTSVATYPVPPTSGIGMASLRGVMGFDPTGKPILSFSLGDGTNEFLLCTDDTCATTTTLPRANGLVNDSMATTAMTVTSNGDVYAIDGLNAAATSFTFTTTPLGSYVFAGTDVGSLALPLATATFSGEVAAGSFSATRGMTVNNMSVLGPTTLTGPVVTSSTLVVGGNETVGGSLTVAGALLSKDPVANIKAFGAKCDGTTDDTVAIQAALTASTNVYIPSGTCISGALTVANDNTMVFGDGPKSILQLKAGLSSVTLLAGGVHPLSLRNLRFFGGNTTSCKTGSCPTSTSRTGVSLISYKNGSVDGVSIDGFDLYGLRFIDATTDRLSHFSVVNSTLFNNYLALGQTADTSEYVRVAFNDVHDNVYGMVISAGNTIVVGNKINDNDINIQLFGTGVTNNGHAVIASNLVTHANSYTFYALDVTLGESVVGNTFIDGPIWLKNSSGINLTSGILNVQSYCLDGGGRNFIRGNHVINTLTNTVTHSCNAHADDTQVVDNFFSNGTWLDNGRTLTQSTGVAKTGDAMTGTLVCGTPDAGVANCLSTTTGRDLTLVPALGNLTSITGGIAQAGTGYPQVCPNTSGLVTTAIDCFDGNFAWTKAAGSALTGYLWGNTGPTQLGIHTADATGQEAVTFLDSTSASVAQLGFGNASAATANVRNAIYIMNYQSNTGRVVIGNYYDVSAGNTVFHVQDDMGGAGIDLMKVDGAGEVTATKGTFSGQVKSNGSNVLTTSSSMWTGTMWGGAVYTTIGTNTPLAKFKTGDASTVTDVYFTLDYTAAAVGSGTGVVALTDTSGTVKCSLNITCASINAAYATSGTCSAALAANTVYELRHTTACTGAGSGFHANVGFTVTTP